MHKLMMYRLWRCRDLKLGSRKINENFTYQVFVQQYDVVNRTTARTSVADSVQDQIGQTENGFRQGSESELQSNEFLSGNIEWFHDDPISLKNGLNFGEMK